MSQDSQQFLLAESSAGAVNSSTYILPLSMAGSSHCLTAGFEEAVSEEEEPEECREQAFQETKREAVRLLT